MRVSTAASLSLEIHEAIAYAALSEDVPGVGGIRLDPIEDSEQAGTRPGVIVSRNAINQYSPVIAVCPLTSAHPLTRLYPSDVLVKAPEAGLQVDSVVLTLQVRAVAKSRLQQRLGQLEPDTMTQVDRALKITLDLS